MPPHLASKYLGSTLYLTAFEIKCFLKFVFLLLILVIAARIAGFYISRRKRRMSSPISAPSSSQEKSPGPTSTTIIREYNEYLQSLRREALQTDSTPIWPWTAPPRQLPGPYDAPYYPLPVLSTRRNPEASSIEFEEEGSEQISKESPTASTALRVSALSIPNEETNIEHSASTSTHGLRRTHWSKSDG